MAGSIASKRVIEKVRRKTPLTEREKAIAKTMKGQMGAMAAARGIADMARQETERRSNAAYNRSHMPTPKSPRTISGGGGNSKRAM